MSLLTKNLKQDVTYWAPGTEGEYGVAGFTAPILTKAHWEDGLQKLMKPSGEEVVAKATVWVGIDLAIGGYLALGDFTAQTSPSGVAGAAEILDYKTVPNLRNNMAERRAFL